MQQNILVKQEADLKSAPKETIVPEQEETAVPEYNQGETIQVFVFYRGEYLGCQCFAQQLVTIGGSPNDDLALPAYQEEDSIGFCASAGGIKMWYQNPEKDSGNGHDKELQKVEALDSFLLGEYRLQVKLLQASGLNSHRQDIEKEKTIPGPGTDIESEQFNESVSAWSSSANTSGELSSNSSMEPGLPTLEDKLNQRGGNSAGSMTSEQIDETLVSTGEALQSILEKKKEEEQDKQEQAAARVEALLDIAHSEGKQAENSEHDIKIDEKESDLLLSSFTSPVDRNESKEDEEDHEIVEKHEQPATATDEDRQSAAVKCDEKEEIKGPEDILSREAVEDREAKASQAAADEQEGLEDREAKAPQAAADEQERLEDREVKAPQVAAYEQEMLEDGEVKVSQAAADEQEGFAGREEGAAVEDDETDEGLDLYHESYSPDVEEEDDEEEATIQYFSLLKQLVPDRKEAPQALNKGQRAVEIVRFQAGDVQDISYLEEDGDYAIRQGWTRSMWKRQGGLPPNFKMVHMNKEGVAELHLNDDLCGRLYSSQESSQDFNEFKGRGNEKGGSRKSIFKGRVNNSFTVNLTGDNWALLRADSYRYLVRYVPKRPSPPVASMRPGFNKDQFKLLSTSFITHIIFILVISFAVPDKALEGFSREAQFARVDPELLKVLKPPPAIKKALKKPKPVPPKKSVSKVTPTKRRASSGKKKSRGGGGKSQQKSSKPVDVTQTGLLGALGGSGAGLASTKGQSEVLLAAVTNLDAVAVPSGAATFNLAGIAGKLASSEIQVPSGDVIETMGATSILKAGNGMLGAMAGSGGDGEVKGIVHDTPKAKISVRGGMSREAVLKVVTAHLDEVRDCYERELLHNPGLSGKILMEWLIKKNGKVRYAKIKFTNIGHSADIHNCIQAQIVTWKFPKPTNGQEVVVTFPFMFENVGF